MGYYVSYDSFYAVKIQKMYISYTKYRMMENRNITIMVKHSFCEIYAQFGSRQEEDEDNSKAFLNFPNMDLQLLLTNLIFSVSIGSFGDS